MPNTFMAKFPMSNATGGAEPVAEDAFARDTVNGLTRVPRAIPSKYFYDRRGSELFRQITQLPEYYLTRCETEILRDHGGELLDGLRGEVTEVVELGAGLSEKTLAVLERFAGAVAYRPVDVCSASLAELRALITRRYPKMPVSPVVGDFTTDLSALAGGTSGRRLVLFLGSSIGNMRANEAVAFLTRLRAALAPGDYCLIGFDLQKDIATIHRAYNDDAGVTAELNLNLLRRFNTAFGGNFDPASFFHAPRYNAALHAMESYLVSRAAQRVELRALGFRTAFTAGEVIHTEWSHKYTHAQIAALARASGFTVRNTVTDARGWFADSLWQTKECAK